MVPGQRRVRSPRESRDYGRLPDDRLCAEETTVALERDRKAGKPEAARLWVVDPIDGTRGYARKNGEFSIMVGLVERGAVVFGAVLEPALGRLTYAVQGGGCHWRPNRATPFQPCRVNQAGSLADATIAMSRSRGVEGEKKLLATLGAKGGVQTYSAG